MDAEPNTDVKLPDANEPESKPCEQLSKADLDGVVGGLKMVIPIPTTPPPDPQGGPPGSSKTNSQENSSAM